MNLKRKKKLKWQEKGWKGLGVRKKEEKKITETKGKKDQKEKGDIVDTKSKVKERTCEKEREVKNENQKNEWENTG